MVGQGDLNIYSARSAVRGYVVVKDAVGRGDGESGGKGNSGRELVKVRRERG